MCNYEKTLQMYRHKLDKRNRKLERKRKEIIPPSEINCPLLTKV